MGEVYIHAIEHFHPENVIDNQFLESLDIGTDDAWITERVGIKKRRSVLPLDYIRQTKNTDPRAAQEAALYTNAQTGEKAAQKALQKAGVVSSEIGMVLSGGCTSDITTPAESCSIAAMLDITAPCIDLNSACSTFGAQIHFISLMNPETLPDFILLVLPENNTKTINYTDRNTAVLWGDGTCAAVVSTRVPAKAKIVFTSLNSDPKGWQKVVIPRMGHFHQEGSAVQSYAIKRTIKCFNEITQKNPSDKDDLFMIGHQANLTMLKSVIKRCNISDSKHLYNVDTFGNTGGAGAPIVLSQNWDTFKKGDKLALIVVGAGLSWSSMKIEFGM